MVGLRQCAILRAMQLGDVLAGSIVKFGGDVLALLPDYHWIRRRDDGIILGWSMRGSLEVTLLAGPNLTTAECRMVLELTYPEIETWCDRRRQHDKLVAQIALRLPMLDVEALTVLHRAIDEIQERQAGEAASLG